MKTRKKLLVLVGVLTGVALVALSVLHVSNQRTDRLNSFTDEELARTAGKLHGPAPAMQSISERIEMSRRLRFVIGNAGLVDKNLDGQICDLALTELTGASGLELVERRELESVLRELQLSSVGLARASDAVRVGKLLRADWFLLGAPAVIGGTNVSVVRIVNAHTGVMQDATVLATNGGPVKLASALAGFVKRVRQEAADPKPKTFLAIETFADLGLNKRQTNLPQELRSYLAAAYQAGRWAVLEREFVNVLLREFYLDMAGLTDTAATEPKPMPAAYWMVDGWYQSYESTNFQVEIVLNVRRLSGQNHRVEIREPAGEPLFRSVKAAIDRVIEQNDEALVFSKVNERKTLMANGKELARIKGGYTEFVFPLYDGFNSSLSENEMARLERNAREAVRSFESVLLLDPTNQEAKMCLATCFQKALIERVDEGREYYREIIESPVKDRWTAWAREALIESFRWSGPDSLRLWFGKAAQNATTQEFREFYAQYAERAAGDQIVEQGGGGTEVEKLAEVRLFEAIGSYDNLLHGKRGEGGFHIGMDDYAKAIGSDPSHIAQKLVALYPRIKAQFPDLAPYALATLVTYQVDTNAAVIGEFEKLLDLAAEHPDKIFKASTEFVNHIRVVSTWAQNHKRPDLAVKILETIYKMSSANSRAGFTRRNDEKIEMAYAYLSVARWREALTIFEELGDQPVQMSSKGPWGDTFAIVLPGKQAVSCREKLGLPPVIDPREFELGASQMCLHALNQANQSRSTFVLSSDGLWMGIDDLLLLVDFDLRTNFLARVPGDFAAISALWVGDTNIWIGTSGGGLFEMDTRSKQFRRFTLQDGLLMDHVSSFGIAGDTLWIGYGDKSGGGLGKLDLKNRAITSFSRSLSDSTKADGPPRAEVANIKAGADGSVYYLMGTVLCRYRPAENIWESFPTSNGVRTYCMELDGETIVRGLAIAQTTLTIGPKSNRHTSTNSPPEFTRVVSYEEEAKLQAELRTNNSGLRVIGSSGAGGMPDAGGLALFSRKSGEPKRLLEGEKIYSPLGALTVSGRDVWFGGQGFVAKANLDENKIQKVAHVAVGNVDQIQVGGGFVWVRCGNHLYRVSLGKV